MTPALVARLREAALLESGARGAVLALLSEAADALEAQGREIAELRTALAGLLAWCPDDESAFIGQREAIQKAIAILKESE